MASDAATRSRLGTRAASEKWATTDDRTAATDPARAAFIESFYDAVDPNRELTPEDRESRAIAARASYFASLSTRSAETRRAKGEARREAERLRTLADVVEHAPGMTASDAVVERIRQIVDAAPPLTPGQLDRLAVLLAPIPTASTR